MSTKDVAVVTEFQGEGQGPGEELVLCLLWMLEELEYRTPQNHGII